MPVPKFVPRVGYECVKRPLRCLEPTPSRLPPRLEQPTLSSRNTSHLAFSFKLMTVCSVYLEMIALAVVAKIT
jgi:hypothetical protein